MKSLRKEEATLKIQKAQISNSKPVVFIGGPCALESPELVYRLGTALRNMFSKAGAGFILKCSFDKANRSSATSYRGIGVREGIKVLREVKGKLGIPLLTDVHEPYQAELAAEVADILQVPAFLCRQTDLITACARTGKAVNIKKGQFLSPWDMKNAIEKAKLAGNRKVMLTERGTTFGYGNLVADMRSLEIMKGFGHPVIFDCTHSVQLPGSLGQATGGQAEFSIPLARAAAAVGIAGILFETHPDPRHALSDGMNSIPFEDVPRLIEAVKGIDSVVKKESSN